MADPLFCDMPNTSVSIAWSFVETAQSKTSRHRQLWKKSGTAYQIRSHVKMVCVETQRSMHGYPAGASSCLNSKEQRLHILFLCNVNKPNKHHALWVNPKNASRHFSHCLTALQQPKNFCQFKHCAFLNHNDPSSPTDMRPPKHKLSNAAGYISEQLECQLPH